MSSLFGAKYLAVLDLDPIGLSDTEAKVLTQRLTSKMIELSNYTIVERANIDKILKEQKFQHSGCTDSECAVEIGQLINADLTIIGTVSKFGKTYTIDSRIINVESGEALHSASYTHTGDIDELVKDGIESIAHKLLGISFSSGTTSKASSGYGATLEINSDPPGAEVYIGGNYFDNTPLLLEDFPAGDYEISIKLTNYKNYTQTVKLQPRGNRKINTDLLCLHSFDCTGVCGGDAVFDKCGVCEGDNSSCTDCSGIINGGAKIDCIGACTGGTTGLHVLLVDCEGLCGGISKLDECGICDADPSNDCDNRFIKRPSDIEYNKIDAGPLKLTKQEKN